MKKYAKEFGWVLLTAWVICLPIGLLSIEGQSPFLYNFFKVPISSLGGAIYAIGIGFLFLIARKNRPEGRLKTTIIITAVVSIFICYSTIRMLNRISESTNENPYNAVVEQAIKEGAIKASPDGRAVLVTPPEYQDQHAK